MGKEDFKDDERFKKILNDVRFKTYKPVAQNVELDKRFEKVLSQKRFAIDDDLFHRAESSSSDESSDDEEEVNVDSLDEWEEEEKKCYKEDCEETKRIAICNLDWDRINSTDIYVLLNSFKPADGLIKSIKIYPSEYGKERMAEELIKGPKELTELPEEEIDDEKKRKKIIGSKKLEEDEDEEINKNGFIKNKLRKYQINRLRYYYAVAEFDSIKTAVSIYEQLDGFEYLNSSVQLDLRFIPKDMEFDDADLKDQCTALPDLNFYKAPDFINTALQQTKVRLTWEESNQDMSKKLVKAFEDIDKNKEVDYLDEYLASETDNEEDHLDNSDYESDGSTKESKIEKYKNLLKSIEDEEEKSKNEKKKFDVEIEWGPELNKNSDEDSDDYELDEEEKEAKMKQEKRNKFRKSKKYKNKKGDEDKNTNSELELIAMKDKEDKKHFNYENYVENSKKVNKDKKKDKVSKDEFKFDLEDPRFKEIYDSPQFNIDPSNPKFKRTKTMTEIISKKIRKH